MSCPVAPKMPAPDGYAVGVGTRFQLACQIWTVIEPDGKQMWKCRSHDGRDARFNGDVITEIVRRHGLVIPDPLPSEEERHNRP